MGESYPHDSMIPSHASNFKTKKIEYSFNSLLNWVDNTDLYAMDFSSHDNLL